MDSVSVKEERLKIVQKILEEQLKSIYAQRADKIKEGRPFRWDTKLTIPAKAIPGFDREIYIAHISLIRSALMPYPEAEMDIGRMQEKINISHGISAVNKNIPQYMKLIKDNLVRDTSFEKWLENEPTVEPKHEKPAIINPEKLIVLRDILLEQIQNFVNKYANEANYGGNDFYDKHDLIIPRGIIEGLDQDLIIGKIEVKKGLNNQGIIKTEMGELQDNVAANSVLKKLASQDILSAVYGTTERFVINLERHIKELIKQNDLLKRWMITESLEGFLSIPVPKFAAQSIEFHSHGRDDLRISFSYPRQIDGCCDDANIKEINFLNGDDEDFTAEELALFAEKIEYKGELKIEELRKYVDDKKLVVPLIKFSDDDLKLLNAKLSDDKKTLTIYESPQGQHKGITLTRDKEGSMLAFCAEYGIKGEYEKEAKLAEAKLRYFLGPLCKRRVELGNLQKGDLFVFLGRNIHSIFKAPAFTDTRNFPAKVTCKYHVGGKIELDTNNSHFFYFACGHKQDNVPLIYYTQERDNILSKQLYSVSPPSPAQRGATASNSRY